MVIPRSISLNFVQDLIFPSFLCTIDFPSQTYFALVGWNSVSRTVMWIGLEGKLGLHFIVD